MDEMQELELELMKPVRHVDLDVITDEVLAEI